MPRPGKSCMKCGGAQLPRCARFRSRNITAASMRRRCSCCWPGSMSNAPATMRRWPNYGRRSKQHCAGSTARAIAIRTEWWNISAPPNKDWPTRAGRIPTTPFFMPTDDLPRAKSRSPRSRAMCLPASGWRHAALSAWAWWIKRANWKLKRSVSPSDLKMRSGARNSVAGHFLFAGMLPHDRARRAAADLMRPHFFTGWGIRTVARGQARYNPMSYHDGSIWPHDNALIALGLARYGLKHLVEHVFKGLFDAATYMDLRRLPELFCGFQREKRRGPTLYPVACAPQAWASATPFTLLEAALGLEFDAARGEIRLRNPRLPEFLNEVVLRDLKLGPSSVDLRVRRHGEEVSLEVLRTRGQIQVSIVLTH